jgi:hypothetical protein
MEIKEQDLKFFIEDYLLKRGYVIKNGNYYKDNQTINLVEKKYSDLEAIISFFKSRGYLYKGEDFINFMVGKTPRIAGIQAYSDRDIKGFYIDNFYCCRFDDNKRSSYHLPGFFMLGLHDFEIKDINNFIFHLETLLDFFKESPIDNLRWDSWSDGIEEGPSIEFYCGDLEVANMVFTIRTKDGKSLKRPYLDVGVGLARYYQMMNITKEINQEVYLLLFLLVCELNGILPGRRGTSDNLKRIYRTIDKPFSFKLLDQVIEEWKINKPAISLDKKILCEKLEIINERILSNKKK